VPTARRIVATRRYRNEPLCRYALDHSIQRATWRFRGEESTSPTGLIVQASIWASQALRDRSTRAGSWQRMSPGPPSPPGRARPRSRRRSHQTGLRPPSQWNRHRWYRWQAQATGPRLAEQPLNTGKKGPHRIAATPCVDQRRTQPVVEPGSPPLRRATKLSPGVPSVRLSPAKRYAVDSTNSCPESLRSYCS